MHFTTSRNESPSTNKAISLRGKRGKWREKISRKGPEQHKLHRDLQNPTRILHPLPSTLFSFERSGEKKWP